MAPDDPVADRSLSPPDAVNPTPSAAPGPANAESTEPPSPDAPSVARHVELPVLPRWLLLVTLAVLLVFILIQGSTLWAEWTQLQREQTVARDNVVVGYVNIAVNPTQAARPKDWYHHDGESTFLWSGWKHNSGHVWFRVGRGDVEQNRISFPMGRDIIQAIDYPIVEMAGGVHWQRIPSTALVVGVELEGVLNAYPVIVLDRVGVINDQFGGRPFLVAWKPWVPSGRSVTVYDPVLDGRRLTMGFSGYLLDGSPLFYDRGTESLWRDEPDGLRAVAGHHKGNTLRTVARPVTTSWGRWVSTHPNSRLVVGADRSKPPPEL